MSDIFILNILRQELTTNSLCFTQTQIDWITEYLNTSTDLMPKVAAIVATTSYDFHMVNIPPFIMELVGIVQSCSTLIGMGDIDMNLTLIKFIVISLTDSGILPIPPDNIEAVHCLVNAYVDTLGNNFLPIEEQTSIWEKLKTLFCSI